MASGRRALLLAAVALAACAAEAPLPPPAPRLVEPAAGYNAAEVEVVIRGDAFHVSASHDVEGPSGDRLSAAFRAWLGEVELSAVTRVDGNTLTAVVPAGLAAGAHDLVVEGPDGARGVLLDAYRSFAGTGPLLRVEAVALTPWVAVGETVRVEVRVTNLAPTTVTDVTVRLKRVVNGAPSENVLPNPPLQDLAPGATLVAVYEYVATAAGLLEFEAKAKGLELGTGAQVSGAKTGVTVEVYAAAPGVLRVVAPATASQDSEVRVELTFSNPTPYALVATVSASCDLACEELTDDRRAGAAVSIAAGGEGVLVYDFEGQEAGTVELVLHVVASDGAGHTFTADVPVSIVLDP